MQAAGVTTGKMGKSVGYCPHFTHMRNYQSDCGRRVSIARIASLRLVSVRTVTSNIWQQCNPYHV